MRTVAEVHAEIQQQAEARRVQEVRRISRNGDKLVEGKKTGRAVRQGDLYFHLVSRDHSRGGRVGRQLARGVTRGSRHVLKAPGLAFEGTTLPTWCRGSLLGPLIESDQTLVVTHPEHAWLELPVGTYQVTYQRDARTGSAVQD
jgi:hypothetical protein